MAVSTKEQLGDTLVSLLETKPLSKITVGEISRTCGVSRMTFYYHFKDIYDLVIWALTRRASMSLDQLEEYYDIRENLKTLFELMHENRTLVGNIYHSVGHDQLFATANQILSQRVTAHFDLITQDIDIAEEDRRFVVTFFSNAVIGVCFDWIRDGMDHDAIDLLVENCSIALSNSVINSLSAFEKRHKEAPRKN